MLSKRRSTLAPALAAQVSLRRKAEILRRFAAQNDRAKLAPKLQDTEGYGDCIV
jgi:hypothetical protein